MGAHLLSKSPPGQSPDAHIRLVEEERRLTVPAHRSSQVDAAKLGEATLQTKEFKQVLSAMERIVVQNIYHQQQMLYRNMISPDLPGSAEQALVGSQKGRMQVLWTYECDLSKGRNVSCMAWNNLNPDLLAVGYGEFDFNRQGDGLVLFWSLKNPEYPQRVYRTECSVTSLAFANKSYNLLAVGLYDGTVAVYDVRKEEDKPVLESSYNGGKHSDSVWEVRGCRSRALPPSPPTLSSAFLAHHPPFLR
jgi:hypothetical protein